MTAYIIKSSVSLLLLFGLYWFLLRKEKLFVFNRLFLIASVVFSLIVPLISVPVNLRNTPALENLIPAQNYFNQKPIVTDINLPEVVPGPQQQNIKKQAPELSNASLLHVLYVSGLLLFLIRFLRNIFLIYQRTRSFEKINLEKYQIVLTNDKSGPCCFFDKIFLNRDDYVKGKIDKELLDHEMEHARQSHTIDIMLIEMVKIFYWFNPIHLLYERAIRINHEYLADNGVININPDIKSYTDKLLGFINCNSNMSLTSGSNNSFTKMRLIMMFKARSGRYLNLARITGTLCIVAIFFMLLSFKKSEANPTLKASVTATESLQNLVRGKIIGEDGKPLKDASVVSKSQNNVATGTTTDANGFFTISDVQPNDSLVIGCFGYYTKTIKPDVTSEMKIYLKKMPDFPEITTVNFRHSDFTPSNALISVNGVFLDKRENLRVNKSEIKSIKILKDKEAFSKYGEKGSYGVLEITLYGYKAGIVGKNDVVADSSIYKTYLSINNGTNKGELIDIPFQNLQSASVWIYKNPSIIRNDHKLWRTIEIMTRDFYRAKGIVVSKNGNPLPGVSITVADSPVKETSGKDGRFSIADVKEDAMLEFSLPEYKPYFLATGAAVFMEDLKIELEKENVKENETVYEKADKMPQYPGGDMELFKFLAENANYPEAARSARAQGRITIRFIVNSEGKVENPELIERVHPALDSVALRAVRMLKGFVPATIGGKPVNVYYNMPITFMLPPEKTENK
jgi:TonB family protein